MDRGFSAKWWWAAAVAGGALVGLADALYVIGAGRLGLGGVGIFVLLLCDVLSGALIAALPGLLGALVPSVRATGAGSAVLWGAALTALVALVPEARPWWEPLTPGVRAGAALAVVALLAGLLRAAGRWHRGRDILAVGLFLALFAGVLGTRRQVPLGPPVSLDAPNLVLVTVDGVRFDHTDGRRFPVPAFERLSSAGTRFDLLVAPGSPGEVAVADLLLARPDASAPPAPVSADGEAAVGVAGLAARMHEAGFTTAAFLGGRLDVPEDPVWDVVDADASFPKGIERTLLARLFPTEPAPRRAGDVVDRALRFVGSRSGGFFVWIHLTDPLPPFDPPAPYDVRFDDGRSATSGEGETLGARGVLAPEASGYAAVRDPAWLVARYGGEVAYLDAQVGRLLDGLDEAGWSGTTLVALVGVAGQHLDDGDGWFGRGRGLDDALLHVPAAMRLPGRVPVGEVIRTPVALGDLGATFLDLVGLPPSPTGQAPSLKATIEGRGIARRHAVARDGQARAVRIGGALIAWSPDLGWTAQRIDDVAPEPGAWTRERVHDLVARLPGASEVPPPDEATVTRMLTVLSPLRPSPWGRPGDE